MNEEELKAWEERKKRWDERMALADKRRGANWKAITNMPMLAPLKAIPQLAALGTSRLFGDKGSAHVSNLGWTLPQTMINPRPTIEVGTGTSEDSANKAQEKAVAKNEKGLVGNYGGINANLDIVYDKKGTVQDKGVSTAKAAASENILTRWADRQSPSKGSVGKDLRRIEELRGTKPPETAAQEQVNTFNAGVYSPLNTKDTFISQRSPFNPANQVNMIDTKGMQPLNIPEVQQYRNLGGLSTNAYTKANMNTAAAEGAGFMGFKDAGTAASKLGAFSKGLEILKKTTTQDPKPNIDVSKGKLAEMDFPTYLPTWYQIMANIITPNPSPGYFNREIGNMVLRIQRDLAQIAKEIPENQKAIETFMKSGFPSSKYGGKIVYSYKDLSGGDRLKIMKKLGIGSVSSTTLAGLPRLIASLGQTDPDYKPFFKNLKDGKATAKAFADILEEVLMAPTKDKGRRIYDTWAKKVRELAGDYMVGHHAQPLMAMWKELKTVPDNMRKSILQMMSDTYGIKFGEGSLEYLVSFAHRESDMTKLSSAWQGALNTMDKYFLDKVHPQVKQGLADVIAHAGRFGGPGGSLYTPPAGLLKGVSSAKEAMERLKPFANAARAASDQGAEASKFLQKWIMKADGITPRSPNQLGKIFSSKAFVEDMKRIPRTNITDPKTIKAYEQITGNPGRYADQVMDLSNVSNVPGAELRFQEVGSLDELKQLNALERSLGLKPSGRNMRFGPDGMPLGNSIEGNNEVKEIFNSIDASQVKGAKVGRNVPTSVLRARAKNLAMLGIAGVSVFGTGASAAETAIRTNIARQSGDWRDKVQAGISGFSLANDVASYSGVWALPGAVLSTGADGLNWIIDDLRR